jgi:bacterioferritin
MNNHSSIIAQLNIVLKAQLACINQCFLHARILKHQGLLALADGEYKESIDSMKFSDQLVERILTLGGIPDMQNMGNLSIGQNVNDMMAYDLQMKESNKLLLAAAMAVCAAQGDNASAGLLSKIAANVDEHIDYIHRQQTTLNAA